MNVELKPLTNFILNHTQFSFKEVPHSPMGDDVTISANFHYEGINASVEYWSVNRNDGIGKSIDEVVLMLISDNTQTAFKIYQRNQILKTILN